MEEIFFHNSFKKNKCMNQFLIALFVRKFRICAIILRADIDDLQILFCCWHVPY